MLTSSLSCLLPLGGHDLTQVNYPLGVTPFVVVPGHDLDEVITHNHGEGGVNDGRFVSTAVITGHQRFIRVLEDSLHGSLGGLEECTVNLLLEGLLVHLHDNITDRHVRGGHTEGDTVELALEGRDDKCDSLGCTSGGGDNVEGCRASTAKIPVACVQKPLVTSVGVSGGHHTADDTEFVIKNLHERSHAVGGAGGVGDDVILVMRISVRVYSDNEGPDAVTLAWGSDEHLLGTCLNVLSSAFLVDEHTSGFDNNVNAKLLPRQFKWVPVGDNLDGLSVDSDGVLTCNNIGVEGTQNGIVLEKVRCGLNARCVVDADNIHVAVFSAGPAADEVASDTTETIDGYLDLHGGGVCGHGGRLGGEEAII